MKKAAPLEPTRRRYEKLLKQWDEHLDEFGGDPSALDWHTFRPLRLRREEDWSDWLAWLLEKSREGQFAWTLFGNEGDRPEEFFCRPEARREELSEDRERRGDLVLIWGRILGIHAEVKVGDKQFEKTYETGRKLQALHEQQVSEWKDFILIPAESRPAWDESVRHDRGGLGEVHVISWEDVACALRKCLWSGREPVAWRAWAWSFCGAIEQSLLGLTRQTGTRLSLGRFSTMVRWIGLLEKGTRL